MVASGVVERVNLRGRDDGVTVCVGSLRIDEPSAAGVVYKTYLPFEAYSKAGEAIGARHPGDTVLLHGKLFWRRYHTKGGEEKSGLALLVHKCSCLLPARLEEPA